MTSQKPFCWDAVRFQLVADLVQLVALTKIGDCEFRAMTCHKTRGSEPTIEAAEPHNGHSLPGQPFRFAPLHAPAVAAQYR